MPPVRVGRVVKADLRVGRGGDLHPQPGDGVRLVRDQRKAQRGGVHDHETVATVRRVHGDRAQPLDRQRHVQPCGEARQVFDEDALRLAVAALGPHPHQPARRLEHQPRLGLGHRHQPAVQEHGRDADRVRPRHRRRVLRLHDDEGGVGLGVLRGDEQVDVPEHPAPRLVQHEVSQPPVRGDPAGLRPERVAGGRQDAAHDDVADLALGVGGDHVDGLAGSHRLTPSATAAGSAAPARSAPRGRSRQGCRSAARAPRAPARNGRIWPSSSSPRAPRAETPAR